MIAMVILLVEVQYLVDIAKNKNTQKNKRNIFWTTKTYNYCNPCLLNTYFEVPPMNEREKKENEWYF